MGKGSGTRASTILFEHSSKIRIREERRLWPSSTIPQPGSCHLWDDVGAFHWWVTEESCGTEHLSCKLEKQLPVLHDDLASLLLVPITLKCPI